MGKKRVRIVVLVRGYLTVEFAGSDDVIADEAKGIAGGPVASPIKIKKQRVDTIADVPSQYQGMKIGKYRDIVKGKYARDGMAVISEQGDYHAMLKHALIRYTEDSWAENVVNFSLAAGQRPDTIIQELRPQD
jgi:hypothetical protein